MNLARQWHDKTMAVASRVEFNLVAPKIQGVCFAEDHFKCEKAMAADAAAYEFCSTRQEYAVWSHVALLQKPFLVPIEVFNAEKTSGTRLTDSLFTISDLFQQLCNTSNFWKQPMARITGSLGGMAAEFTECPLQSADCCAHYGCLTEFPIKLFVQHNYCLLVSVWFPLHLLL